MQSLIHADIFFFITSIVTVVLAIFFAIALFYIILILRDLRELSGLVRKGGETLAEDISDLRQAVLGGGSKVFSIFDYFLGLFTHRHKRKTAAKKKTHE
jgi:hypothetical protein